MSNAQKKNLIDELPIGLKENLSVNENVVHYLRTFNVVDLPDYIVLTNLRLIYFNEKHLGRYEIRFIPFQKLLQMRAHRGALLWGDISFKGEDGTVISLERVDRDDMTAFIDALKIEYNAIAVEPISIKYEKDLVGMMSWQFDKPAEVIFRQQPVNQSGQSADPIDQLKMRFIKGEISEEEYRSKLRVLQEK